MPVEQSVETPEEVVRISIRLDEALEDARRRRGIRSWAEVARRSGLGPTPLSQLVTGKVNLSEVRLGTLAKLCAALDLGIDELVRIEPVSRVPQPRMDRPISDEEFARVVASLTTAPVPDGWTEPTEADLDETELASTAALAARFRGRDTLQQRFGLR
ncbi:MAG: helix-turn-helix transcriptional regulator [Chloroflexi bacterium]|nr:helix-turn-helix transcriptional regulator [Chloroflexota bacterium]